MGEGTGQRRVVELLRAARESEHAAQVRQLELVCELVDAYATVEGPVLPGSERLVPSGAAGTPEVAEFIAAELGPALGESIPVAWARIRDAVNLRHRHPVLWRAVRSGLVPVWQARVVARECAKLGADACLLVDERLRPVWGRLAWGRIRRRLAGLVVDADHALARAEAEARRAERFVHIRHEGYGSSVVTARLDTSDALALQGAIEAMARGLVGEGRAEPLSVLRAEVLGGLARPSDTGRLPRPHATLVVHVARSGCADPDRAVARSDEIGPVLLDELRSLLGHHRVSVLPVVDLAADPSADSYEIPTAVSRHVRVRESFSQFPFSAARRSDLDHTAAHRPTGPPGQTRASNLAPLARSEHRPKTFGGWRARQPAPGVMEWESPLGYHYRVRGGLTRPITPDEVVPWDPTGVVHHYPPPDAAEVVFDQEFLDGLRDAS